MAAGFDGSIFIGCALAPAAAVGPALVPALVLLGGTLDCAAAPAAAFAVAPPAFSFFGSLGFCPLALLPALGGLV